MDSQKIKLLIALGETSTVQFKLNVDNEQSFARELVAFANSKGGKILIGVDDNTWNIIGLEDNELRRLKDLIVNAANEHVKPAIFIESETILVDEKKIMVVSVPEGIDKPYKDKEGIIFLKNGANKRKVTSNEEISRLLQENGYLYAEERLVNHSTLDDISIEKFKNFYEEKYHDEYDHTKLEQYLENLRLGHNHKLSLAAAILFGKKNEKIIPSFFITAIWFKGNTITGTEYRSSKNIFGTIDELFNKGFDFIVSKLDNLQNNQSFNSIGKLEIPELVLTEILVNALIHRDYFINDSIKIFVFDNRVEIISPGKLPNSLTADQVKRGVRRTRNTIIASFAPDIMEYRGAGSGILRALQLYPAIDFINDAEAELFKVIIHRPEKN
jgi:ATP-dependent DNA helicase RecG